MENIERIFNEVFEWHKLNGVKIRKQNEKRDCHGKLTDPCDQAYYDLIDYYIKKSDFSQIEMEFLLYCQEMWLLQMGGNIQKKFSDSKISSKINFFETEKKVLAENHYLSRFSRKNKLPLYQRKTYLEENCCYKLINNSKYYFGYYIIQNGKLKRQPPELGYAIIGLPLLKKEKKLTFKGFYELDSKFLEVPVFNIEMKNGNEVGIILFNETKSKGNQIVVMVREQFERLNSFENYERVVSCPIDYI